MFRVIKEFEMSVANFSIDLCIINVAGHLNVSHGKVTSDFT